MNIYVFVTILFILHAAVLLGGFYLIMLALDHQAREKDYEINALTLEGVRKSLSIADLMKEKNDVQNSFDLLKKDFDQTSKELDKRVMGEALNMMKVPGWNPNSKPDNK